MSTRHLKNERGYDVSFKDWFKKYFPWIAFAASLIASFFVGRKSVSGNLADYERLRNDFDELQRLLEDNKRKFDELVQLKSSADSRLKLLETELENSRLEIIRARKNAERNDSNIADLDETIERLRSLAEQHKSELESIQVTDDSSW